MVNIRKSHLRKSYLVGLSEVGLPESISHQKVPPQLLCIICTVFALLDSFEPTSYSKKCLVGSDRDGHHHQVCPERYRECLILHAHIGSNIL